MNTETKKAVEDLIKAANSLTQTMNKISCYLEGSKFTVEYVESSKAIEQVKVLICEDCKTIWIAPKEKCDCGCSKLTETHKSNVKFAKN